MRVSTPQFGLLSGSGAGRPAAGERGVLRRSITLIYAGLRRRRSRPPQDREPSGATSLYNRAFGPKLLAQGATPRILLLPTPRPRHGPSPALTETSSVLAALGGRGRGRRVG